MRRSRRFVPGNLATGLLEIRCVPAWFLGLIPQSYNTLTDSNGVGYSIDNGTQLINALNNIQATGATITDMTIKGHGGEMPGGGLIMLTDDTTPAGDQLLWAGGKLLVQVDGGQTDITGLLVNVSDQSGKGGTAVRFLGCSTGDLGQNVSGLIGGNNQVTSTSIPAIGLPLTQLSAGVYVTYENGQPPWSVKLDPPDPNAPPPVDPFGSSPYGYIGI